MIRRTLYAVAAALALAVPAATAAIPADVTGEIKGAPYRIVVPASWNGTLVVYAHGYRDLADHPGEVDNRAAEAAPDPALEPYLLAQGYALAGSAYKTNGWAVEEGVDDTVALVKHFTKTIGKPKRTLLWGFSMGSVVTLDLADRGGDRFDGYLPACAVGAGAPRAWDGAGVLSAAYGAAFGWPATWGTPADVRDTLDFDTEVFPKLLGEISNLANWGKFEFMRLVSGAAPSSSPPPPSNWMFTNMFFATEARAELERRAGGPVGQNLTHTYSLSASDKLYLQALGVDADALLATMNAGRTVAAPKKARKYLERNAEYKGKIKRPVLTLHTQTDALVPASHESAYAATVAGAGRSENLVQAFTDGDEHCEFTGPQLLTALGVLDNWVATGTPPTQASFPAALGFLPGHTPPAWPQP